MKNNLFRFRFDVFILFFLLLVSSIFLMFSGGGFVGKVKTAGFSVSSGIERAVYYSVSFIRNTFSSIKELAALQAKCADLSKQVKKYKLMERSNAVLLRENYELKKLLQFSTEINIKNVPAEIIGFDANNLYSGIIINKGTSDGIRKNMPVIAFQGNTLALVGKIVQAGRFSSMIIPIYDYQCYVASKMEISKHRGIINGQGSNSLPLVMKYVKKKARDDIKVGDMILTSGLDDSSIFPKNIPVGYVTKINIYDYETSLELLVEPIIDFSSLEYVFILNSTSGKKEF